jgi:RNA polymerase sigma factor (sigma-70 family)
MATTKHPTAVGPDSDLINLVRAGRTDAYGTLYELHVGSAYHLARQLARGQALADDLVAEAFMKVLDTLRAGGGPDSGFRAYLLTTLRHIAYDRYRRERKLELTDDVSSVGGVRMEAVSVPFTDPALAKLEHSLAAQALSRLPQRWYTALTYTEIDGMQPGQVAQLLNLTPNGVRALTYRARKALHAEYLQAHLRDTDVAEPCRATFAKLGAWARDNAATHTTSDLLSKVHRQQVDDHLRVCDRCQDRARELATISPRIRRNSTSDRRACTRRNPLPPRTRRPAEEAR